MKEWKIPTRRGMTLDEAIAAVQSGEADGVGLVLYGDEVPPITQEIMDEGMAVGVAFFRHCALCRNLFEIEIRTHAICTDCLN